MWYFEQIYMDLEEELFVIIYSLDGSFEKNTTNNKIKQLKYNLYNM